MAKRDTDFQGKFLDLFKDYVDEKFDSVEKKIDDNTTETKRLADHVAQQNGSIKDHAKMINQLQTDIGKKRTFLLPALDNKVLTLLTLTFLVATITVAYLLGAGELISDIVN